MDSRPEQIVRQWLRSVQAQIDANEAEHDHLIALRRELVSTLVNDWGVRKSVVSRDIGRSYMVISQDLKAVNH
jgi:hypothetical protein